jgi:hypothetical protein
LRRCFVTPNFAYIQPSYEEMAQPEVWLKFTSTLRIGKELSYFYWAIMMPL